MAPPKRPAASWLLRAAVGAAALAIVLAGAAAIVIPRYLEPARLKALVEREGSAALGRPIAVSAVSFGLLSGIVLEGLVVGPPPGNAGEPLLTAGRAVVRFRLLPLLWLEVVLDRIEVVAPRVAVSRDAKGGWSFADLLAAKPGAPPASERRGGGLPVRVAITLVRVADGAVSVRDEAARPPLSAGLEHLNLDLQRFSLEGAPARVKLAFEARLGARRIPVAVAGGFGVHLARAHLDLRDLSVALPGVSVVTNGTVDEFRSTPRLALTERLTVDLAAALAGASAFLPNLGPLPAVTGRATVDATLGGTPAAPKPAGTLALHAVTVSLPNRPRALDGLDGSIKFDEQHAAGKGLKATAAGIPLTLGFEVGGLSLARPRAFTPNGLTPRFEVALPGVTASGSAGVTGWPASPRYVFSVKTGVELAQAWKLGAGLGVVPPGSPLEPAGSIAAETAGSFAGDRLSFKTTAVLKGVSVRHRVNGPLAQGVEGSVGLTEDRCDIPALKGALGGQPFMLSVELSRLGLARPEKFSAKTLAPKGKIAVTFAKLDADRMRTALLGPPPAPKPPSTAPVPPEPEPDLRGLVPAAADVEFSLRADELTYGKLVLSRQRAKVRLAGGRASWSEEGALYGGTQSANGTAVLESYPLKHDLTVAASGIAAGPFLDAATETFQAGLAAKGKLTGTASFSLKSSGEGVRLPALRNSLVAGGEVSAADGRLTGTEFLKGGLGRVLHLDWLGGGLAFRRLGGAFTLAHGVVTTPEFGLDPGDDGDLGITYKGTVDFDQRLKGTMLTRFHPRRADEVSAGEVGKALFTKDAAGWAVGEWDVAGTAALPIVTPSKRQLAKRALEVAKEKYGEEMKNAAKEGLKKLFGR